MCTSPGLQGVEVVVKWKSNGGLVLAPPPRLQAADQAGLTLVKAVHTLLQQLETLLRQPASKHVTPTHTDRSPIMHKNTEISP